MSPKLSGTTYYVYLMDIAMSICFKIRDTTSYYLVHIMEGRCLSLMEVNTFGIYD